MSAVSDVQTLLDDTNVFWVDAHLFDALNQAQLDVWQEVRFDITTATLSLTASDTFVSLPAGIMIPQRIMRAGYEWYPTTYLHLMRDNASWRNEGLSTPRWFVNFDSETLMPYPRPSVDIEFVIEGVRWPPTEIATGTLDFTAQLPIKQAVIYKAAALLSQNTRPALAGSWNAIAEEWLAQTQRLRRNQFKHQMQVLQPGTVWSNAQQGALFDGRKIGGSEV